MDSGKLWVYSHTCKGSAGKASFPTERGFGPIGGGGTGERASGLFRMCGGGKHERPCEPNRFLLVVHKEQDAREL